MVHGAIAQRSAVGTVLRSMISGKMKSYRASGDGRVVRRDLRKKSWSFLVSVEGRKALFSSVMMKYGVPWVPLVADFEPLIGQQGILISKAHGQAGHGWEVVLGLLLLGFSWSHYLKWAHFRPKTVIVTWLGSKTLHGSHWACTISKRSMIGPNGLSNTQWANFVG